MRKKKKKISKEQLSKECFSLNSTILEFVYPRLKYFVKHHTGYPVGMKHKQYKKILRDMLYYVKHGSGYTDFSRGTKSMGFTFFMDMYIHMDPQVYDHYEFTPKERARLYTKWFTDVPEDHRKKIERYNRGKIYFFKYFDNLWM